MFVVLDENVWENYRSKLRRCGSACNMLCVALCFILMIILLALLTMSKTQKIHVVYLATFTPTFTTNKRFLSIALDASVIASDFNHFHFSNPRIVKMMGALAPAYFRIGGIMADRLIFTTQLDFARFKHTRGEQDGGECAYLNKYCDHMERPNFTMNGLEWLQLNKLAEETGLEIIFGLNALRRFNNGTWDYTNAQKLIEFSNEYNLTINWELGNEPNAFRHQFNYFVDPTQLAKDFHTLKKLINKYPMYRDSLLLGPDVTRPQMNHNASQIYLENFLPGARTAIDAVTWHQYYFNGATADIGDFIDPQILDVLKWQIQTIKTIVTNKPVWLGETSSAYGGGAPHLSNRYVATFMWLDKLGLAAKYGVDVVIRQSIFQGHYALINDHYNPTPDWWVSILYKKLVGPEVLQCLTQDSPEVRLYCHCAPRTANESVAAMTVFGVNIQNRKAKIRLQGYLFSLHKERIMKVHAYVLTATRIDSRFILLNNVILKLTENNDVPYLQPRVISADPYVEMPAFSLAFWVVPLPRDVLPYC